MSHFEGLYLVQSYKNYPSPLILPHLPLDLKEQSFKNIGYALYFKNHIIFHLREKPLWSYITPPSHSLPPTLQPTETLIKQKQKDC